MAARYICTNCKFSSPYGKDALVHKVTHMQHEIALANRHHGARKIVPVSPLVAEPPVAVRHVDLDTWTKLL